MAYFLKIIQVFFFIFFYVNPKTIIKNEIYTHTDTQPTRDGRNNKQKDKDNKRAAGEKKNLKHTNKASLHCL